MSLAALLLVTALVSPQPAAAPPALSDPYQIFANARASWAKQRYPSQLQYTVVESGSRDGQPVTRHYSEWWSQDGGTTIDPVSQEERAQPFHPGPGFDIGVPGLPRAIDIGGRGSGVNDDLVGIPKLAPNYSFAIGWDGAAGGALTPAQLVQEVRAEYHDPSAAKVQQLATSGGPQVIATVVATQKHYNITLVGVEPYADHRDYHIALTPLHDPGRYRLRALWIDTNSFATDKLIQDGNFTTTSSLRVPWTVTFQSIEGARYIDTESESLPLGEGRDGLHDVSFTFEQIAPATTPRVSGGISGILIEP